MAWIDSEGVTHTVWIYEPRRLLGPVLAASIDGASIADLRSATGALADLMVDMLDEIGDGLEVLKDACREPTADMQLPEDMIIESSLQGASLNVQVGELVKATSAQWRVEVLQAVNDVIHDRIDERDDNGSPNAV